MSRTSPAGVALTQWDPIVIRRLEAFRVAMPVSVPYTTSFGSIAVNEAVLVHAITDSGDDGWGESAPLAAPEYSGEWAAGALLAIRDWLGPALVGARVDGPAAVSAALDRFRGNWFAKAALDIACWDIAARRAGLPLHRAVGGTRDRAEVGAAFGIAASIDDLLADVEAAVAAGTRRVKLKMTSGWEVEVVAAVRAAQPDILLHVDCNGHYTLDDVDLFRSLDPFGLAMLEQPLAFDDLVDHAQLARRIGTPICLDESITSAAKVRKAAQLGSCRYVNIKPGRVGGLSASLAIDEASADAGIPTWIGGMLESQVGAAICAALATRPNVGYPADVFPAARFYEADLARPELEFERDADGGTFVRLGATSGIAPRPDPDRLEACAVERVGVDVAVTR